MIFQELFSRIRYNGGLLEVETMVRMGQKNG